MTDLASPPRTRLPRLNHIRKDVMARTLASPPQIIVAERDAFAVAQANPQAVVVDRENQAIRRDRYCRNVRAPRTFRLADLILSTLPQTDLSRKSMFGPTGIKSTDDLSFCLRQVRHNLEHFGIGITTSQNGRVFITEVEAASC